MQDVSQERYICIFPQITDIENPTAVKGMHYNPTLYRWEGNENALAPFDIPLPPSRAGGRQSSPPRPGGTRAVPPSTGNSKSDTYQRPALITNITTSTPSIQVVGGMVFDPQRMCWLKLKNQPHHNHQSQQKSPSLPREDVHDDVDNDSDDPFAGLDDLDDNSATTVSKTTQGVTTPRQDRQQQQQQQQSKTSAESSPPSEKETRDEWLVGEEFDVGPEFIRRQREEEHRWRKKVEIWTGNMRRGVVEGEDDQVWRWDIRGISLSGGNGGSRF